MVGSQASAGLDSYLAEALTGTRRFFTRTEVTVDPPAPESTHSLAWQAQSLLLGFPDQEMLARLDLLRLVSIALDDPLGGPLGRFIDHLAGTPAATLAREYTATFDHPDRCLFLTYGSRRRDRSLRRLEETYRSSGLRLTGNEPPDHLGVLLEYAAAEPRTGAALLTEHRAAVQLLRLGLRDAGSPWADVLDSVWATLPPLVGDEWLAVAGLAALRPAHEPVGTGPSGPSIPRQRGERLS
ncbi:MAG: nitrate reductase molybdenum cofactor assembly chaperone [Micromonosporaceae bacterium]|jgi:nitrate reductase delta subunit|nr:nitrate reductase molybdenum cofactor assembly chaperone [Micromonosporaceae bacterium]